MARRRSLNRRWSRRSMNATELDQDSEFFDEDNPVWWKNLPDASSLRASIQTSLAETTVPNLTPDSLVNDSELQDRWWDNLDRTSLQSSRRFSARKSVNPEEVAPDSFVSEGDGDVSIKKRKVLLRARAKRSVGTENFLKAFDDSDVAHSEPAPSKKRKPPSPTRSETDLIQRKIRHSRSLVEQKDTSPSTSNDTDIVIKARPKAFKKRDTQISSDVYDQILSNAGPSGINTSKNASRSDTPEKTIDSNDSGFIRPTITGSHQKRLSTISKKLDLTSDESEDNVETIKSRRGFQLKSKENASFNPFDEILSGQLNESIASADAPNKSGRSSNAAMRISKSLKQNQSLQVSVRRDEGETKEASDSESQLRETERTLTDAENDRRSVSAVKDNSRVSKKRRSNEEDNNEATINEWNVPETQEIPDKPKINSTMIEESVNDENSPESQDKESRSSLVINKNARYSKDATNEWNVPETQENANLSTRHTKHSTIIEESVGIDKESQDSDRRSSELKKLSGDSRRVTKNASMDWNVPETQEDVGRIKNSTMIEESIEIDRESQDKDRRSSVMKKHSGDSRRHTKDATNEWDLPVTQNESRKSTRIVNESIIIEESGEIDNPSGSQNRRSSSVLKQHSIASKSRTGDAGIENTATSKSEVRDNPENSSVSDRMQKSAMIEESDVDELPESEKVNRRSSTLKRNSRLSKRNTINSTIEEVPETQDDSRISIIRAKTSTDIGESMEIDKLPKSQETDRKSSSVPKGNLRVSKRLSKDPTIEETAADEWELPETREDSRISMIGVKNSTMIEESAEGNKLPETNIRSRRSSSVSKKSLRTSKRRTREATIDEATIEEDELPTFDEKSAKFTSTFKQNSTDRKRRADSVASKNQSPEQKKLAEKSRSQLFEDWESSGSEEEEDINKSRNISHNDSHNSSLITKTLSVSINRLSPTVSSHSRHTKESKKTTEGNEEMRKSHIKERSVRSRSRNLLDSAYELPDRDRSASLIISGSEDEPINKSSLSNRSKKQSSKSRLEDDRNARKSVNRSISDKSRRDPADVKKIPENKTISTKTIGTMRASQQEDSDSSISEELAIGSQRSNLNLSEKSSRGKRKVNESKRAELHESINETNAHHSHKSNKTLPRKSARLEMQIEPTKSVEPTNSSQENPSFPESISEAETEMANNASAEKNIKWDRTKNRSSKSRKSSTRPSVSGKREESGESSSEEELNSKSVNKLSKDKSDGIRKKSGRPNVSRQRIESDESISEEESNLKALNQSLKAKNMEGRKSAPRDVSKQQSKFHETRTERNSVDLENINPTLDKSVIGSNLVDKFVNKNATIRDQSAVSNVENIGEDPSTSIPSETIPLAPNLTKLPQNTSSLLTKSNKTRAQKNITDFFPSKFLQQNDSSKNLDSPKNFDKEKLDLVRKEIETKRRQMAILRSEESSKKKEISSVRRPENITKINKLRAKENTTKVPAKPPKVVDKAYIVNGQVYKRPKLPRPKPWVTDRLYRHLWKRLEPKYNMRTRVKSEHFVEQLSEVVALTIRRKKYDSYKAEVDALMKEMARLNIIKTRNDFYDFCYDFLPYDFRVKVTPMFLPGNIRNIPYDPAKLHTPILSES